MDRETGADFESLRCVLIDFRDRETAADVESARCVLIDFRDRETAGVSDRAHTDTIVRKLRIFLIKLSFRLLEFQDVSFVSGVNSLTGILMRTPGLRLQQIHHIQKNLRNRRNLRMILLNPPYSRGRI